ncbi:hypothetical protein ACVW00_003196 [Marmoricola sp. URHA0025 HA25]
MVLSADLEGRILRLRADRRRYQGASDAALDELDRVIGYLEQHGRAGLARGLRRNRASILRALGNDPRRG